MSITTLLNKANQGVTFYRHECECGKIIQNSVAVNKTMTASQIRTIKSVVKQMLD